MTRYDRRAQALAISLSWLAGYVDAIGFLAIGGVFISFMSGNSTRLAVGIAHHARYAMLPAGLIGAFLLGVILGSITGRLAGGRRRPVVLALVAGLLAGGAGLASPHAVLPALALSAIAMGATNAVFERDGEVSIGLTYMTGTLVKVGQRITAAAWGDDPFGWAPYLLLWLGLLGGAIAGAEAYGDLGLRGLWIAAGIAAVLAVVAAMITPPDGAAKAIDAIVLRLRLARWPRASRAIG